MFQDVSVIDFMMTVVFIVFFSISFGMQLTSGKGKEGIIRWFKNALTRLLRYSKDSGDGRN